MALARLFCSMMLSWYLYLPRCSQTSAFVSRQVGISLRSSTQVGPSRGHPNVHLRWMGGEAKAKKEGATTTGDAASTEIPLYQHEGLFAVDKPLGWTSNDVVSYVRGILERDARSRGANPVNVRSRKRKSRIVRVGHGGTLDPLATGVLVIGVGKGTKQLQRYLTGSKCYRAIGEFGYETTTLDKEGEITKTGPIDHITHASVDEVMPDFVGKIMQVPPIYSAIRKNGKKLYESAREGVSAEEMKIEPRQVEVYNLNLSNCGAVQLPQFQIEMECGGGTFVRSLIRDIGYKLDTAATTTLLERTKQGPFTLVDCLSKPDWSAETIYSEIEKRNRTLGEDDQQPAK